MWSITMQVGATHHLACIIGDLNVHYVCVLCTRRFNKGRYFITAAVPNAVPESLSNLLKELL